MTQTIFGSQALFVVVNIAVLLLGILWSASELLKTREEIDRSPTRSFLLRLSRGGGPRMYDSLATMPGLCLVLLPCFLLFVDDGSVGARFLKASPGFVLWSGLTAAVNTLFGLFVYRYLSKRSFEAPMSDADMRSIWKWILGSAALAMLGGWVLLDEDYPRKSKGFCVILTQAPFAFLAGLLSTLIYNRRHSGRWRG